MREPIKQIVRGINIFCLNFLKQVLKKFKREETIFQVQKIRRNVNHWKFGGFKLAFPNFPFRRFQSSLTNLSAFLFPNFVGVTPKHFF
jgi:hypothetical protein